MIRTELKDPRIGLVTLTGVEVSGDHRHAKVFFTVLGEASAVQNARQGLARSAAYLRRQLAASLRLRVVPELHFIYDESVARGARISRLIDEAVEGGGDGKDEQSETG